MGNMQISKFIEMLSNRDHFLTAFSQDFGYVKHNNESKWGFFQCFSHLLEISYILRICPSFSKAEIFIFFPKKLLIGYSLHSLRDETPLSQHTIKKTLCFFKLYRTFITDLYYKSNDRVWLFLVLD